MGPRHKATTGMTDKLSTTASHAGLTGTYVYPASWAILTLPPPLAPSSRRITGSRIWFAYCSEKTCLAWMAASPEPPRTVKSSAPISTGRPSMRAVPATKLAGRTEVRRPSAS